MLAIKTFLLGVQEFSMKGGSWKRQRFVHQQFMRWSQQSPGVVSVPVDVPHQHVHLTAGSKRLVNRADSWSSLQPRILF